MIDLGDDPDGDIEGYDGPMGPVPSTIKFRDSGDGEDTLRGRLLVPAWFILLRQHMRERSTSNDLPEWPPQPSWPAGGDAG